MRAATYARVSSEEQVEGYSLDAQLRAGRAFVEEHGWTPYREYVEEGRSAHTEDIRKRPVFREAMDDALAGKFDVLIVHKIDRFSRKLRVTLEYFDKLGKAGVGFVSIQNQMDYSTPQGKFFLVIQGGLAELYSDNLGEETKKGWDERRNQGLYCGLLPFGAMKGEDGVPVPDTREHQIELPDRTTAVTTNYNGLLLAFNEAAKGVSDGAIAQLLNQRGYRTTGNRGSNPFSKDTVRGILTNRFYLGELPVLDKGKIVRWTEGRHQPFISEEIWQRAQDARERNRRMPRNCPSKASICSLTGIARCWYCGGRYHVGATKGGRRRLMCYNRAQRRADCPAKSAPLDLYEEQIGLYLTTFRIPEDYQAAILTEHGRLQSSYDRAESERASLKVRMERLKKLYAWGDISEEDYLQEKRRIERQLQSLAPRDDYSQVLRRLATFLRDVSRAWAEASQEQRNRLLRQLFDEVWIQDDRVAAVRPRTEFEPFFKLSFDEWLRQQSESAEPMPLGVANSKR
jgi:site-specific DNA recombinase